MKDIVINIEGMSCGNCVKSITTAINSIKGIEKCSVDLTTKKANVVFDDSITTVQSIINKIEDIGFEANI